jgi:uncharacterized protein with NRDE domain
MVIYRGVEGFPVVLAANRDEYYARPSEGPQLLRHSPAAWGGRDGRAGGTWLGVNAYGLVVGLTNRRVYSQENDLNRRSRGLLCLDALQYRCAAEVVACLDSEAPDLYNPFNLLLVDHDEAFWIAYEGKPETRHLQPGLYLLANGNLNDFETVRIRRARRLLQGPYQTPLARLLPLLEHVCRDHEAGVQDRETICMHREDEQYGTVSSTIIALSTTLSHSIYRFAEHHPCCHPYRDYSALFTS